MAKQRSEIAMSPQEVDEFLQGGGNIQLALYGPDGYPDITPMWFVVDQGAIWMRTYGRSQKVLNARRDPRCCLVLERGEHYVELRGVQVTGDLQISEDLDRICWVAARLMVKYEGVDPEHIPALEAAYMAKAPKQVALSLPLERVVSWDHRKLS
ncbi:MAG: pyridoxamine 5'-phosphate oxidase family protein [Candidatus Nanopelagicales bacterium]|jgi:PPOX class probable F420-dependent enzyme|nr:pyridoxamine 5'-phosphate oxidase family protein [Candidatus Nanopelagicales bacterium]MCU0295145.1 pyridoxamine 5'-phosphate oxidase family protein [Candidatus Nanopelagicales bacterium]